jgi:hypothetical protein
MRVTRANTEVDPNGRPIYIIPIQGTAAGKRLLVGQGLYSGKTVQMGEGGKFVIFLLPKLSITWETML